MRSINQFVIIILSACICGQVYAQKVSSACVQRAVEHRILNWDKERSIPLRLGVNYYIKDVVTGEPITQNKYGIYEFGVFGMGVTRWILWYDPTGYKIYDQVFNTEVFGELLAFLERNKYSAEDAYSYVKGVQRACRDAESVGIKIYYKETTQRTSEVRYR